MSKPVELHPQVEFDIDDEVAYLNDHGPTEVENFVFAVEAALEAIALAPLEKAPWLIEGLPSQVRWAPSFDANFDAAVYCFPVRQCQ